MGTIRYWDTLRCSVSMSVVEVVNNAKACASLAWTVSWPCFIPLIWPPPIPCRQCKESVHKDTRLWRLWWGPDTLSPALYCPPFLILRSFLTLQIPPPLPQGWLSDSAAGATRFTCSLPHRLCCLCGALQIPDLLALVCMISSILHPAYLFCYVAGALVSHTRSHVLFLSRDRHLTPVL